MMHVDSRGNKESSIQVIIYHTQPVTRVHLVAGSQDRVEMVAWYTKSPPIESGSVSEHTVRAKIASGPASGW